MDAAAREKGIDSDEIEIWFQDEARIGQKNKLTRRWAKRGTRPSAPRDQRTASTYIFGAVCPQQGKGAALILPACNTEAMNLHLVEIAQTVEPGAHAVLLVDQAGWLDDDEKPINDVNDHLQLRGVDDTAKALRKLQDWMIPGMMGNDDRLGKPRLYLPAHDYLVYWKFRVQADFTKAISKTTKSEDGDDKLEFADVCGFRVAAVSRVSIASDESTMTGNPDNAPTTMIALSVQTARHGPVLGQKAPTFSAIHQSRIEAAREHVAASLDLDACTSAQQRGAAMTYDEIIAYTIDQLDQLVDIADL